jgi:hypothetical protein
MSKKDNDEDRHTYILPSVTIWPPATTVDHLPGIKWIVEVGYESIYPWDEEEDHTAKLATPWLTGAGAIAFVKGILYFCSCEPYSTSNKTEY